MAGARQLEVKATIAAAMPMQEGKAAATTAANLPHLKDGNQASPDRIHRLLSKKMLPVLPMAPRPNARKSAEAEAVVNKMPILLSVPPHPMCHHEAMRVEETFAVVFSGTKPIS